MSQTTHPRGPEGSPYQILSPDPKAAKPYWWIEQGKKVELRGGPGDINERQLTIASKRAWLHLISSRRFEGLEIDWSVRHGDWTKVRGFIEMDPHDLASAFSLQGETRTYDQDYLARFGAEVGKPGSYMRKGPFLILPNPGIGREGDSNMSILITPPIQAAVQRILIGREG